MKKLSLIICFAMLINIMSLGFSISAEASGSNVCINEVVSSNKSVIDDKYGVYSDYVELYNSSPSDVDLSGYYLSDSTDNTTKWAFPEGAVVRAGGFLLIFASGNDTVYNGEIHTSFKISTYETITLSDASGQMIDSVIISEIPEDTCLGRMPDGGAWKNLSCTPDTSNASAHEIIPAVANPTFSYESGFYGSDIQVVISQSQGYDIYYTTDFSNPTISSTKYTGAITVTNRTPQTPVTAVLAGTSTASTINKSTVIRAIAVDSQGNKSDCITKTYFVGIDKDALYGGIPVISISTDQYNLFDTSNGIYANPMQRGREWEREANITYIDGGGNIGFSQNAGIRIRGDLSRRENQKSFNIFARSDYGKSSFDYPVIPGAVSKTTGKKIKSYKSFEIRNGGNFVDEFKFMDPSMQSIGRKLNVATQDSQLCAMFLNGEYWGPYYIQEKYSADYVEDNYGVDKDDIVLIKNGALEEGETGDFDKYYMPDLNFANSMDMTNPDNYKEFCKRFDIDSLCEYFAMMFSVNNTDWPHKNYALWRSKTVTDQPYQDGKWRFMAFDMDLIYWTMNTNMFEVALNANWIKQAIKNQDFKKHFIMALCDTANLLYTPKHIKDTFWSNSDAFMPYFEQYCTRFGKNNATYKTDAIRLMAKPDFWQSKLEAEMSKYFGLNNAVDVVLQTNDSSRGTIMVDDKNADLSEGALDCRYYTEYPLNITAVPKTGYTFSHWYVTNGTIDNMNSPKATVTFNDDTVISAVFTTVDGDGTNENPYKIINGNDLEWMSGVVNSGEGSFANACYELCGDVDFDKSILNNHVAIGSESHPFNGTFLGNGHVVSGINITSDIQGQGLFGYTGATAHIEKVGVTDAEITGVGTDGKNVAAIVGNNGGTIINCYSTGSLTGISTVGGIAGNNNGGTVTNCWSKCEISCESTLSGGGISGKTEHNGQVINCYSLIIPVAKIDADGFVDTLTARVDNSAFTDGSLVLKLNRDEEVWVQGTDCPVIK